MLCSSPSKLGLVSLWICLLIGSGSVASAQPPNSARSVASSRESTSNVAGRPSMSAAPANAGPRLSVDGGRSATPDTSVAVGRAEPQVTPIVNPTTVAFVASIDHASVSTYAVELNRAGAVVKTVDLGKQTPDAANTITTPLAALLAGVTPCTGPSDGCYTVTVTATNGFGVGRSAASSPFSSGKPPAAPGSPAIK